MMLWMSLACAAPVLPNAVEAASEPIQSEALTDIRMMKRGRMFGLTSVIAPMVTTAGVFAAVQGVRRTGKYDGGTQTGLVAGSVGWVGMAAPSLWMHHARHSRLSLERQGLRPKKVPMWGGVLLNGLALAAVGVAGGVDLTDRSPDRAPLYPVYALGAGLYIASLTFPLRQERANQRARIRAGWWEASR